MNNLVWFGNNLRVDDNVSLKKACDSLGKTIGVYCVDPKQFAVTKYGFRRTEKFRAKFLLETLAELKRNLAAKNISLLVFYDEPENVIPKLVDDFQIDKIFIQKEFTVDELKIIDAIKQAIPAVKWTETYDQFLFHPDDIPYKDFKSIPKVFTEFRKQCEKSARIRTCVSTNEQSKDNLVENSTVIPTLEDLGFADFVVDSRTAFPFAGGENQALKRVENYFFETENIASYKQTRNGLVGDAYSSKFSPWLANGSISARTIYWQLQDFENEITKNEDTYWLVFELIWRDFFKYVALKHG